MGQALTAPPRCSAPYYFFLCRFALRFFSFVFGRLASRTFVFVTTRCKHLLLCQSSHAAETNVGTITDLKDLPRGLNGSVVTMGDFDGLHTGHRVLIDTTVAAAKQLNLPAILVTYEPSPKKILKKLACVERAS